MLSTQDNITTVPTASGAVFQAVGWNFFYSHKRRGEKDCSRSRSPAKSELLCDTDNTWFMRELAKSLSYKPKEGEFSHTHTLCRKQTHKENAGMHTHTRMGSATSRHIHNES
jgi:hypothetical protein